MALLRQPAEDPIEKSGIELTRSTGRLHGRGQTDFFVCHRDQLWQDGQEVATLEFRKEMGAAIRFSFAGVLCF